MDSYEIRYEQVFCTDYEHSGTVNASGSDTEYTLTELQEYSVYRVLLIALSESMSALETREFSTLQAGI